MVSEVRMIYVQDRIIRKCVAYPRRFGLTNYFSFLKKHNPLYQIVGKFD